MTVIYSEFPELSVDRFFTPAETGILSGISPEKQRQIRHKGWSTFLDRFDDGKHARFDWREVVLWSLMAEAQNLGFGMQESGYFAAGFSTRKSSPSLGQLLENDFRLGSKRTSDSDRSVPLYVFCFPEMGKPESFANLSTGSGNVAFDGSWKFAGRWGWWLNYSDFQRRLLLRYESIR